MFESEIYFKASRSSGSGGQNVNKVSTKVELNFDVSNSRLLTDEQKRRISEKLFNFINKEGILKITSQESRSQLANKEITLKKFRKLIASCFEKKKKRIHTKATKGSKEKRLSRKKKHSDLKKGRSRNWF
ncbi:MAG: aminoacyl-tRNA hydrolase [Bacteroidetes bacterium]|nr:aminoacyl-tRNA hydrolase [Bacteroidota bacterium]